MDGGGPETQRTGQAARKEWIKVLSFNSVKLYLLYLVDETGTLLFLL